MDSILDHILYLYLLYNTKLIEMTHAQSVILQKSYITLKMLYIDVIFNDLL